MKNCCQLCNGIFIIFDEIYNIKELFEKYSNDSQPVKLIITNEIPNVSKCKHNYCNLCFDKIYNKKKSCICCLMKRNKDMIKTSIEKTEFNNHIIENYYKQYYHGNLYNGIFRNYYFESHIYFTKNIKQIHYTLTKKSINRIENIISNIERIPNGIHYKYYYCNHIELLLILNSFNKFKYVYFIKNDKYIHHPSNSRIFIERKDEYTSDEIKQYNKDMINYIYNYSYYTHLGGPIIIDNNKNSYIDIYSRNNHNYNNY